MGTLSVTVYGEAVLASCAKKHPASRNPLARFLKIARAAEWPHFAALKKTFSTADLGKETGKVIFNIGGNKYRLVARVNFSMRALLIDEILTHEQYNRETL